MMFFFFNDTATTEIYTLSLHDALPISNSRRSSPLARSRVGAASTPRLAPPDKEAAASWHRSAAARSEEHTSELQSPDHLVCRLLLEKKKNISKPTTQSILRTPSTYVYT